MARVRGAVLIVLLLALPSFASEVKKSEYRGWPSLAPTNGLVETQVVPDIGGRSSQSNMSRCETPEL